MPFVFSLLICAKVEALLLMTLVQAPALTFGSGDLEAVAEVYG